MPRPRTGSDWVNWMELQEPPDPSTCDLCKGKGCKECVQELADVAYMNSHEPIGEDE